MYGDQIGDERSILGRLDEDCYGKPDHGVVDLSHHSYLGGRVDGPKDPLPKRPVRQIEQRPERAAALRQLLLHSLGGELFEMGGVGVDRRPR